MPITVQLAARLKAAAKGRADHAPLLLQGDGSPWGDNPGAGYHREVKQIVTAIGADPDATMYALRHSSHRADAAEKRSDPAGGVAAQHHRPR